MNAAEDAVRGLGKVAVMSVDNNEALEIDRDMTEVAIESVSCSDRQRMGSTEQAVRSPMSSKKSMFSSTSRFRSSGMLYLV